LSAAVFATEHVVWYPNPVSVYLHGAAFNPNAVTFDFFTFAQYQW
jgi:hypothetical protein